MARTWAWILTASVAAGAAAAPTAKTGPARRAAPASRAAADQADDDSGVPEALVAAAGRGLVKVHYHFKKDVTEEAGRKSWAAWRARLVEAYVNDKTTLDAVGVVIAPGTVLVRDDGLEDRFIEKIEVVTSAGKRFTATRGRLLDRAPLETLKVKGKLAPPKYVKAGPVDLTTSFRTAGLIREGEHWRVTYGAASPSTRFDAASRGSVLFKPPGEHPPAGRFSLSDTSVLNALQLVADERGRPVGVCSDKLFDARQQLCLWRAEDLRRAAGADRAKVRADRVKLRASLLESVHEVKITFRQGSREDGNYTGVEGREISVHCLAVSKRRALLPRFFSRKVAAKIEKIDIKYGPNQRARARFVGAYKDFGAALIELTKSDFPGHVDPARADPPRMRPLWAVSPRQRDGKTDVDLTLNRLMARRRGYKNEFNWMPDRGLPSGTFLLTSDGKLAGIQMRQRVEHEEQRQLAEEDRIGRGSGSRSRLFPIGEIRLALAKPADAFDANIKVLPKLLAKRRHWLGVEYEAMSKDLAEQMKVERATKDGTIGFLLSVVYRGSPAAEMGVAVDDILLAIRVEGQPYPVELKSALAGRDRGSGGGFDDGTGPPSRTWKGRGNFLTKVLDAIGAGKAVHVTYYDADAKGADKVVTRKFTVRRAPPDFDSAPRWKNRKVGLTVKDLTYEVRLPLSLADDAPGVVVAKIEPGSPANVARIWSNEIITACDGKPVKSARQLRDMVAAARKAGKDKVRLTILRLGKTRFADLTIKAYDPSDDEDLDD